MPISYLEFKLNKELAYEDTFKKDDKIRKEAKALMDEFMAALDTAEKKSEEIGVEREESVREAEKCELTEGFPERMLKNAPSKKGKFLVAEKKKW